MAVVVAAVVCAAGIGFALASAFGERGATDEITGLNPADSTRTKLAGARAALARGEFDRANQLFVEVDRAELDRGNENAEARTYVGWTFALSHVSRPRPSQVVDERLDLALLALNQAIEIEPTYADPYCFAAIIEFNFRDDADAALPFVEQCEANNPPADVAGADRELRRRDPRRRDSLIASIDQQGAGQTLPFVIFAALAAQDPDARLPPVGRRLDHHPASMERLDRRRNDVAVAAQHRAVLDLTEQFEHRLERLVLQQAWFDRRRRCRSAVRAVRASGHNGRTGSSRAPSLPSRKPVRRRPRIAATHVC